MRVTHVQYLCLDMQYTNIMLCSAILAYIYINMNRHNHSICCMQHEHMQAHAYIGMLHTCNLCLAAERIDEGD